MIWSNLTALRKVARRCLFLKTTLQVSRPNKLSFGFDCWGYCKVHRGFHRGVLSQSTYCDLVGDWVDLLHYMHCIPKKKSYCVRNVNFVEFFTRAIPANIIYGTIIVIIQTAIVVRFVCDRHNRNTLNSPPKATGINGRIRQPRAYPYVLFLSKLYKRLCSTGTLTFYPKAYCICIRLTFTYVWLCQFFDPKITCHVVSARYF